MSLDKADERYQGFVVSKVLFLKELQCTLRELVHEESGAEVMHLENNDSENLFCLSFKTLPSSSNGVAHILEHTVLCGSKKFPIKDPFFAMTRRSLNTFMNAMTGADFTCYPAASQVEKDYYNLLDVYLDAVFHPQLKKASFLQEGHRLEFADPKDPSSLLEWKGIVFNEMKGALSAPDSRLWHALMENLVPDLTYAHVSGGEPKDIPKLTYEELIAFHETYYHPSRCLFFFYGNLPLKNHLDFILEKTLKHVPKQPPLAPIPLQKRFSQAVRKEGVYPITETENLSEQCLIGFAFLTAPLLEQGMVLALCVLDAILMDTDASPLKYALLESGLCVSADAYMDTEMTEVPYVIVCKGCKKEDADALEELLKKSLVKIAEEGIPRYMIEAAIHQLEFSRTEIAGDHAPYGLTLFMRSALAKQHGCAPENALLIHTLFEKLLKATEDPSFLPKLLKKHLIDNPHFVRMVMRPAPALSQKEEEEGKKRLEKIQKNLKPSEVEAILKQTEELAKYQKEMEGQKIDCLPKVELNDVPIFTRDLPIHIKENLFHHDCFTNGILYADLAFDLPHLEEEELPLAQLLVTLLPELGAGKRDYVENLEYLQAHTGGVAAILSLHIQTDNPHMAKPAVILRGKALHRKADKLFAVLKDMAISPRVDDKKRVEELIMQVQTALQNRFAKNALRYAMQKATSGLSLSGKLGETWHGLSYFKMIQELAQNFGPKVMQKLQAVKEKILSLQNPHLILSCDGNMQKVLLEENYFGSLQLPTKPASPWRGNYAIPPVSSEAYSIASPVAFTCLAFKASTYLHPHAPALYIASHILDNKILHPKIREQGGADGAGASYNPMVGHFTFHSYRDPHIAQTLKAFNESIDALEGLQFNDRDLEEAKLGMIQQFDVPIAPGSRGATAYAWWREGKTKEMRQKFRDHLLATTRQEVQIAVQKELFAKKQNSIVVTFAGPDLLAQENPSLAKPLPIIQP